MINGKTISDLAVEDVDAIFTLKFEMQMIRDSFNEFQGRHICPP